MRVIDSLRNSFLKHKRVTRLSYPYLASTQFYIIKKPKGPIPFYTWPFLIICVQHDHILAINGAKLTQDTLNTPKNTQKTQASRHMKQTKTHLKQDDPKTCKLL